MLREGNEGEAARCDKDQYYPQTTLKYTFPDITRNTGITSFLQDELPILSFLKDMDSKHLSKRVK
jgi:hypothetical protein